MNKDVVSGAILIAVSGIYYAWSNQIAESTLSDEVGAAGLPHVLAILLAILGALLIVRALLASAARTASASGSDDDDHNNAGLPRAIGFLLLGALYVFILPFTGYITGVALLIAAVAIYEGAPRNWTVPVAAIGGGLLYWAIFVKLLGVHQPAGTIFQGLLP
ncbi:tripartite tricarboxylate transporter TctB family protein [Phyllobacterium sp. SB3]|uniref:tripartite tricarboxylate transporter TctB family protein n=1 Tax=Phyllobacterium sp. SB3 TaxID=3156073 RepID=UPI0032AEA186